VFPAGNQPLHDRVAAKERLPGENEMQGAFKGVGVGAVVGTAGVRPGTVTASAVPLVS
jgi:hypothetical protein